MQIYRSQHTSSSKLGSVAIYYKTDPFGSEGVSYKHTNNWEIYQSVKIWNSFGFDVDVIDRNCHNWIPDKKYDIFLGLGVGNTGEKFVDYAKKSKADIRCLIAMGPSPVIFNPLVNERYDNFKKRTGISANPMRTSTLSEKKFDEIIKMSTSIITIGQVGVKSYNTLCQFGLPIYTFFPAISQDAKPYNVENQPKSMKNYLSFSGNGLICKGVDLLVESFAKRKDDCFLHICGPNEEAFNLAYSSIIKNSKNIKYHEFIDIRSEKFKSLISKCTWIISHSAAEACATAVSTCIKSGLVPVINEWNSIDVGNAKIKLDDMPCVENIDAGIDFTQSMKDNEVKKRIADMKNYTKNFSQTGYTESYSNIVKGLIGCLEILAKFP